MRLRMSRHQYEPGSEHSLPGTLSGGVSIARMITAARVQGLEISRYQATLAQSMLNLGNNLVLILIFFFKCPIGRDYPSRVCFERRVQPLSFQPLSSEFGPLSGADRGFGGRRTRTHANIVITCLRAPKVRQPNEKTCSLSGKKTKCIIATVAVPFSVRVFLNLFSIRSLSPVFFVALCLASKTGGFSLSLHATKAASRTNRSAIGL